MGGSSVEVRASAPSLLYPSTFHTVKSLKNLTKQVMTLYRRRPVSSVFKYFLIHLYGYYRMMGRNIIKRSHSDVAEVYPKVVD